MRRIVYAFCTAVCVLFTAVSCSRSNDSGVDDLGGGITNNNFSNEVTRVVPLDLIQKMAAGGATIHGGTNPPRVEGFFRTGGMLQLRHSTLGAQDPLINKIHDGFYYKFYQQNGAKLKMNYQNFNRGYGARGVDAVISGEGNKFTIFYIDKAGLESEKKVRLNIIKEIRSRLQGSKENTPGVWSDFEYDFSRSIFFYPVDFTHSYYAKPVNFSGSAYWGEADFSYSTYMDEVYFNGSIYQGEADFRGSMYRGSAGFARSTYRGVVYFNGSTYLSEAVFRGSVYRCAAAFNDSAYRYWVDLRGSTYQGAADFGGSTYQYWADFRGSTYRRWAYFNDSICCGWVGLSHSVYEGEANFSGSIFCSEIYFGQDGDNSSFSRFAGCAPQFYDETNYKNTLFGSPDNDFSVENGRGHPIYLTPEGLPLNCAFLAPDQGEYLKGILRRLEEISDEILAVKNDEEKKGIIEKRQPLDKEFKEWREKVTTAQRTR